MEVEKTGKIEIRREMSGGGVVSSLFCGFLKGYSKK